MATNNTTTTLRYSSSGRPLPLSPPEEETTLLKARTIVPPHLYVLPVLLLEFLALALTRAVLPGLLLREYGRNVYLILGCAECVRGLLAFFACPLFGQLSDHLGRRPCLFVTVLGTCAPVCSMALWSWSKIPLEGTDNVHYALLQPKQAMTLFVALLAMSGLTSSTFTLVFCYISDTVLHKVDRLSAYGLALATFGLSFTLGTLFGGYLAETGNPANVFRSSCILALLDLAYIFWILPESKPNPLLEGTSDTSSNASAATATTTKTILIQQMGAWKPFENLHNTLWKDPFLRNVGILAFLYYTGLSAVISTISLYTVSHFGLTPKKLGELMSALGACTMLAEAVLVRYLVPYWGETKAIRVGLLSFAGQCFVLGIANQQWHLFVCVGFSLLANLVYPSLSSLVTDIVETNKVGEALGSLNGVKALTEGIGPLVFGALMTISEESYIPGWPYCVAALLVLGAYKVACDTLPQYTDEYVHELEFKKRREDVLNPRARQNAGNGRLHGVEEQTWDPTGCLPVQIPQTPTRDDDEEYQDLLPPSQRAPLK